MPRVYLKEVKVWPLKAPSIALWSSLVLHNRLPLSLTPTLLLLRLLLLNIRLIRMILLVIRLILMLLIRIKMILLRLLIIRLIMRLMILPIMRLMLRRVHYLRPIRL